MRALNFSQEQFEFNSRIDPHMDVYSGKNLHLITSLTVHIQFFSALHHKLNWVVFMISEQIITVYC